MPSSPKSSTTARLRTASHRKYPSECIRARHGAYTVHRNSLGGIGASNFPFYFLIRCLADRQCGQSSALSSLVHCGSRALFISFHDLWAAHSLGWLTSLVGNERDLQANHNRREIDTIYREITKRNNSSAHTPHGTRPVSASFVRLSAENPLYGSSATATRRYLTVAQISKRQDRASTLVEVKYPAVYYVVRAASEYLWYSWTNLYDVMNWWIWDLELAVTYEIIMVYSRKFIMYLRSETNE